MKCEFYVILLQLTIASLSRQDKTFSLNSLCNRVRFGNTTLKIEKDFSKIMLTDHSYILVYTVNTTIKDYLTVKVGKPVTRKFGVYKTFNIKVKEISGVVDSFKYTLSYHSDKPQHGSMTYVFKNYVFKATCKVVESRSCFRKCTSMEGFNYGDFEAHFTPYSLDEFLDSPKEKEDVIIGFQSAEIYKINKYLSRELLRKINYKRRGRAYDTTYSKQRPYRTYLNYRQSDDKQSNSDQINARHSSDTIKLHIDQLNGLESISSQSYDDKLNSGKSNDDNSQYKQSDDKQLNSDQINARHSSDTIYLHSDQLNGLESISSQSYDDKLNSGKSNGDNLQYKQSNGNQSNVKQLHIDLSDFIKLQSGPINEPSNSNDESDGHKLSERRSYDGKSHVKQSNGNQSNPRQSDDLNSSQLNTHKSINSQSYNNQSNSHQLNDDLSYEDQSDNSQSYWDQHYDESYDDQSYGVQSNNNRSYGCCSE